MGELRLLGDLGVSGAVCVVRHCDELDLPLWSRWVVRCFGETCYTGYGSVVNKELVVMVVVERQ